MLTSVKAHVLPTLRSTVHLQCPPVRRGSLRTEDAPSQGNLEAELVRGPMPERDRDAPQVERAPPGGVGPPEVRAAASEPRRLDQLPVGLGEVVPPTVGIREQIDGRADLSLQLDPCTRDLPLRLRSRQLAEIGVGEGMG